MTDPLFDIAATHSLNWIVLGVCITVAVALIASFLYIKDKPEHKIITKILLVLLIAFPFIAAWLGTFTAKAVINDMEVTSHASSE